MVPRETGVAAREALRLAAAAATRFDLALLDMQMPEMDGFTLAARIREPTGRRTLPLVLLTSLGRRDAGAMPALFAAYLTKPVKQSQLLDALVTLFAQRRTHGATRRGGHAALDATLAARHPLRILLAEDNAVNQKLALRLLRAAWAIAADRGRQRPRGARGARAPALRRRADGRADAGDGRPRGDAPHPPAQWQPGRARRASSP